MINTYKKTKQIYFLMYIFVIIAISSCTWPEDAIHDVSSIYGTYVVKYPFGNEKLIIFPNGEYTQEIFIRGKTKIRNNHYSQDTYIFDKY